MKGIIVGAILAILGVAISPAKGAVEFNVIDMGKLSSGAGALVYPTDINSAGDVVGYSQNNSDGFFHAFRYSSGTMSDIKPPGTGTNNSYAQAITDAGEICGYYASTQGFRRSSSGTSSIGFNNAGASTWFEDMNSSGVIVGMSGPAGSQHAFSYQGGVYSGLGLASQISFAWALNDAGMIVGEAANKPVIFNGSATPTAIGTFGGQTGRAAGVNASGSIVGYAATTIHDSNNQETNHAFLYANGNKTDLGTMGGLSSFANDINATGWIVGASDVLTPPGDRNAFLYRNGAMTNLNTLIDPSLGWTLESGEAINDLGVITGYGWHGNARSSFLLVPVGVPEPSLTSGVALGVLVTVNRRRRRPAR